MLGERLKSIRKEQGFTLERLSELYNLKFGGGMSKGTLSKYENGKQMPLSDVLGNLACVLGVTADALLGDNDDAGIMMDDIKRRLTRGGMTYGGKPVNAEDAAEIAGIISRCMENLQKRLDYNEK